MLRNMVAVLAAIGLVFALAAALPVQGQQSLFPYPRSTKPVESVTVYSDMYLDPQDNLLITLLTLGVAWLGHNRGSTAYQSCIRQPKAMTRTQHG